MRQVLPILIALFAVGTVTAQTLVSTFPMNKVAVIEEFTGQLCPNCPAGHQEIENMISAHGHDIVVVGYHPDNSSYTTGSNFARSHADAFYSTPWVGSSRFMPSAMIARRKFSGQRIQGRTSWNTHAQTIMAESSPVNVGLQSDYNAGSNMLTIDVEVYFTSDVTTEHKINVLIMESGLVESQSGGSSSYIHNHVFRESLTAQWGDPITESTNQGDLVTKQFTYDNTSTQYDMANVVVMVFITGPTMEGEAITGAEVDAIGGKTTGVIEQQANSATLTVFPNPISNEALVSLMLKEGGATNYTIYNLIGEAVHSNAMGELTAGEHSLIISKEKMGLAQGMYLLKVQVGNSMVTQKLMVR
jgi:hypothetical protein